MTGEDDYQIAARLIRDAARELQVAINALGRRTQDRRIIERRERLVIAILRETRLPETRVARMVGLHRNSVQGIERRYYKQTGARVRGEAAE